MADYKYILQSTHQEHDCALYSKWKHVFQNPAKTQWLKYNTWVFRLLHKFKHIQWIKQGVQRQLEIPRGTSRYIKAQLLAIYSFQILCSVVLVHGAHWSCLLCNSSNEPGWFIQSRKRTHSRTAPRPAGHRHSRASGGWWLKTPVSGLVNSHEIDSFHFHKDSRSGCILQGKAENWTASWKTKRNET